MPDLANSLEFDFTNHRKRFFVTRFVAMFGPKYRPIIEKLVEENFFMEENQLGLLVKAHIQKSQTEQIAFISEMVNLYGMEKLGLIADALDWLMEREPVWDLPEPMDKREFIKYLCLGKKADEPGQA